MTRLLMATTAMLTIAAVGSPAWAQLAVRIGGSVAFQGGYAARDSEFDDSDAEGLDFRTESEIVVSARGSTDNGLTYGAKVEMLTSPDDVMQTDEVSLFVSGGWGRLEFGDFDGAADAMQVHAPVFGLGQIDGPYDHWSGFPGAFVKTYDTGDSTKITYYTPRFHGLQAGISYAPYLDEGESVLLEDQVSSFQSDLVEVGLTYGREIGPVALTLSAAYVTGNSTVPFTGDFDAWALGAQATWRGLTLGAAYVDQGESAAAEGFDVEGWNLGVAYQTGRWTLGASYLYNDFDGTPQNLNDGLFTLVDRYQAVGLGVEYLVAPGLALSADLVGYDMDAGIFGFDDDEVGYVFVSEIKATF